MDDEILGGIQRQNTCSKALLQPLTTKSKNWLNYLTTRFVARSVSKHSFLVQSPQDEKLLKVNILRENFFVAKSKCGFHILIALSAVFDRTTY